MCLTPHTLCRCRRHDDSDADEDKKGKRHKKDKEREREEKHEEGGGGSQTPPKDAAEDAAQVAAPEGAVKEGDTRSEGTEEGEL